MAELLIEVEGGTVSLVQAAEINRRVEELPGSHWHFNNCGCCVTVHGPDCAYVIGRDGEATFFAERGCDCP